MAAQRFPSGRMGPPPGFGGIQLDDFQVERDAYGQPLSPTHHMTINRTLNELSPARDTAETVKSQSYNLLGQSAQSAAARANNSEADISASALRSKAGQGANNIGGI